MKRSLCFRILFFFLTLYHFFFYLETVFSAFKAIFYCTSFSCPQICLLFPFQYNKIIRLPSGSVLVNPSNTLVSSRELFCNICLGLTLRNSDLINLLWLPGLIILSTLQVILKWTGSLRARVVGAKHFCRLEKTAPFGITEVFSYLPRVTECRTGLSLNLMAWG